MNKNLLLFLLVSLLAASFRVTNLDLIEFKTDEAINLLLALYPLLGFGFPYGGTVSSIGILNPPVFNYILTPIVAINSDPKFVAFFIGLINSFSVAVFFLIVKQFYNLNIALIGSILFALSPWAILYSRKIWMQDLLIPFFLLSLYSIHRLVKDKKQIFWLPYIFSSLTLIQLHQASILFVGVLTLFLLKRVKLNAKYIFLGIILGLLPLLPYLFHQLSNACPDCQSFLEARKRLSAGFSFEHFMRPLQILSQGNFRFIMGNDTLTFAQEFPLADSLRRIFYFEYILLPVGILIFAKKFKTFRFLAVALVLLPFLYFVLRVESFMHYYIIVLPLLFLFLACAFDYFISNRNLLIKYMSLVLLASIIAVSLLFNYSFFALLRQKGSLEGDYGSAFYLSEKENKERIKGLQGITQEEAFLESFIPLNYAFGFEPLGKMLYGTVVSGQIPALEEKLVKEPENQKVRHQLLAFYTKNKPNIETVDFFREKSLDIPAFEPLYKEVYRYYLSSNFKKEYIYNTLSIRFFYPEHWQVMENDESVTVSGDGYGVIIYRGEVSSEGVFKTQELGIGSYKASYFEDSISKNEERQNRIETIEDIISSVRPL